MKTSDFYYDLPLSLIAQSPLTNRDDSKLLCLHKDTGKITDCVFSSIGDHIKPGDVLVRNTTRVIPARLFGTDTQTNSKMEFLLLNRIIDNEWEAIVKPAKKAKIGKVYNIGGLLMAHIVNTGIEGKRIIRFDYEGIFEEALDKVGLMPLPPYIKETLKDKNRYQTVYAKENGSSAAPTAGLHFTQSILDDLNKKGVIIVDILLHVGLGTFRPVKAENIENHHMHSEYYEVSREAAYTINNAKASGARIIAVGTTACRTLESVTDENGLVCPQKGWTDIFITPGYNFKMVDALITNFHLPESTLLMLVSAFASKELIMKAYEYAIQNKYRFFSFGDAMLIQ